MLDPGLITPILLAHAGATWALVGLIWFVQLVHYPLMAKVGSSSFAVYSHDHQWRTTLIVAPLMLIEATCTLVIVVAVPRTAVPADWALAGLVLWALVWLSTFAWQVPLHKRLSRGFDAKTHRTLVVSNWLRTALWTARGFVALGMLA